MYSPELLELDHLNNVQKINGYNEQIGHLLSMMNYARITTFDAVNDLSISDLDFLIDDKANTIGMLLLHIASVEYVYHKSTIENRSLTQDEEECWLPALNLGEQGRVSIKGKPLEFTLNNYPWFVRKPWKICRNWRIIGYIRKPTSGIIKKQITISNGSTCSKMKSIIEGKSDLFAKG